jgi:hypothetical protein
MKETANQILKWSVVGGSAIIAVNSLVEISKAGLSKKAIMPVITLLVGVSAFSYAMTAPKISLLPKTDSTAA